MTLRLRRALRRHRATHRQAWGEPIWRMDTLIGSVRFIVVVGEPDFLVEIKRQGSGLACLSHFGQIAHIRKVTRRWWIVRYAVHRALAWNPR